ncbi:helix-turn-helix domain-containing protein [Solihabitans fulvus]|nr:helix-turn-helix transcriptional regulator [Solihabitans fulvus]
MSLKSGRALTGGEANPYGRVAGSVLATIRRLAGFTQERLAERLPVAPTTLQGWESGRKPLLNVPFARLSHLRRTLLAVGARSDLLRVWDVALEVDAILSDLVDPDLDTHPLALVVPDRLSTELLTWPLTGRPPRQLAATGARLDVHHDERAVTFDALRRLSEQAKGSIDRHAMLRRQVQFLLANDPKSTTLIAEQQAADLRQARDIREWSPAWALVRSTAVTAAGTGDLEPLQHFIQEGLSSEQGVLANLSYWAYWVGELPERWSADSAMINGNGFAWSGERLFESLLDGVVTAPYRDLCAHTLWALLRCRRQLASHPARRARLLAAAHHALDGGQLTKQARHKLDEVIYATEVLA